MSRADEVFALFVDANPVADVTTAAGDRPRLQSILPSLEGSVDMQTQDRPTQLKPPPPPRAPSKRLISALAGAAAVIVAILVGVAVFGSPGGSDTDTPVAGPEEVAVVASAYDALNAGDIDAWLGHFTDDAAIFDRDTAHQRTVYEILAAANYRAELVEPCRSIAPGRVECTIAETNDFHAAGGITLTRREVFVLNGDGRISEARAEVIAFTQPGYYAFNQAFYDWLRTTYPDVHAEIGPELASLLPPTPDDMRTALDYMDEFLAQSDVYPVGDAAAVSPVDIARSFIEARNVWDADAAAALLAPDAVIDDPIGPRSYVGTAVEDYPGLFAWYEALDWRFTVETCTETDTGALCTYSQHNDWARALDLDPTPGSFVFVISEGLIVELTHIVNVAPGWQDFRGWLALTHPDDLALMYRDPEMIRDPRFTPESIALWEQRTAEWVESIS